MSMIIDQENLHRKFIISNCGQLLDIHLAPPITCDTNNQLICCKRCSYRGWYRITHWGMVERRKHTLVTMNSKTLHRPNQISTTVWDHNSIQRKLLSQNFHQHIRVYCLFLFPKMRLANRVVGFPLRDPSPPSSQILRFKIRNKGHHQSKKISDICTNLNIDL